jgi:DNA polymerase-3 subunit delta'
MKTLDADSARGEERETAGSALPGIEAHPHAQAILEPALPPGSPSHAYLFHGPAGTGKRAVARAFAAALIAEGAGDESSATARVERGTHPDLTWVTPTGAAEMLVSDIDVPVVSAASRRPFESRRRLFVIEGADRMNDQAANRLLKTLEEPPRYAHLILLSETREAVLATVASRCQEVRFDALAVDRIVTRLVAEGVEQGEAQPCARLALGDGRLAGWLARAEGRELRASAERLVGAAIGGTFVDRPWLELLESARREGQQAALEVKEQVEAQLELLPKKEHRRYQREGSDAERRAERRERAARLDLGLRLAELWLRDAWCLAKGAEESLHAVDRREELGELVSGLQAGAPGAGAGVGLREGVELVAETRLRLPLNVSEELALEVLTYRLHALLAP